jgi:hypothetical protein
MPKLSMLHRLALAAAALLAPVSARAHSPIVEFLQLVANESSDGWRLEVELEGSDVSSIFLDPPGAGPLVSLDCELTSGGVECFYQDPPAPAPGFPSLAALLAQYPAGSYGVSVDAELTAQVDFAPIEPNGLVTVTSPVDGAVGVAEAPSIEYVHGCSNCNALLFELEETGSQPDVGLEAFVLGSPPPSPGSVAYAVLESFAGPKPPALPLGPYRIDAGTAVGSVSIETFDQGGSFEYTTGALREVRSVFTVPEPASPAAAALAALSLLAARLRRRERGRRERAGLEVDERPGRPGGTRES